MQKPPKMAKNSQIIFLMPIFTTRGGADPKVMGTVESGLLRRFFWHLKIQNPIIFGRLAAVLANVHDRRRRMDGRRRTDFERCRDVPELRTGRLISVYKYMF